MTMWPCRPRFALCLVVGSLELGYFDLGHLQHRLRHAIRLLAIGILHQFHEDVRDDLPGHAELVGKPAAHIWLAALRESVPIVIDLVLRVAMDDERDCRGELVLRAAVEGDERLPIEPELGGHHGSLLPRPSVAIAINAQDLGILENRYIEARRLFGPVIKPEERGKALWHGVLLTVGINTREGAVWHPL